MNKDYYKGFEGEPEITFRNRSGDFVRMWIGYFDDILTLFKPEESGYWTEIARQYNEHTGWYDDGSWQIPDVQSVLSEFESIKMPLEYSTSMEVKDAIIALLKQSKENGDWVEIIYD